MMRRTWQILFSTGVAALFLLLLPGCSFLSPTTEYISITTIPNDALVYVNGARYSGSPMFVKIERRRPALLTVAPQPSHDDPTPEALDYVIWRELSARGVLDCVGSVFILPITGLFSPGSRVMATNNVVINLFDPLPPED